MDVALTLESKKQIVAEVSEVAKSATALVAAHCSGIKVPDMTQLRKEARAKGVYLRIVRNTLARRAFEGTEFACVSERLIGPMLLAFSKQEPSGAARLLRDFAKTNDKLVVQAIALSGQLLPASALESVAKLPTKDEAISQLMALMKAPVQKLVGTMAAVPTKLVRVVVAIKDQKSAS
jgi:large subunit ribosomal protein L10